MGVIACAGSPSHLPVDSQLILLSGGRYMPMGGLLVVVKWLAEASFLRLLWLQVVIRQDRGRLFPEPVPASAYGCHLYLHLSLPRHGSSPDVFVPLSHTLDELQHFSGRDIPRAWVSGSVVDLLVRTCLGEGLGSQPQGCQLSDGRRADRECLGLLHWKPVENLGTA